MQRKRLGFVAAFYLITKPLSCLLFSLKIAPKALAGSGVCLSAPSWFPSAVQVDVFICQGTPLIKVLGTGKNVDLFKNNTVR